MDELSEASLESPGEMRTQLKCHRSPGSAKSRVPGEINTRLVEKLGAKDRNVERPRLISSMLRERYRSTGRETDVT